jgi:drug/metabolite transporter (DMT)-like permease
MFGGDRKMNLIILMIIIITMTVMAQIFMKRGMNDLGKITMKDIISPKIFRIVFDKFVFVGLALYALSSLLYLVALSMENVSVVYPLVGMGYLLTAILAWLVFGESLTMMKILGIVLISTGAYFVVMKR